MDDEQLASSDTDSVDVRLVDFGSAFVIGAGGKGEPKQNSGTIAYRCVRACTSYSRVSDSRCVSFSSVCILYV